MLRIDDQLQDIAALASRSSPGRIELTLKPGSHTVSIHRRGYQPFEQTVKLVEGKAAELHPVWSKIAAIASSTPKPTPAPAEPKPVPPEPPVIAKTPPATPVSTKPEAVAKAPPSPTPAPPQPPTVAEKPAVAEKPGKTAAETAAEAEQQKHREAEARYVAALQPAEELIGAWDFRAALAALDKLPPTEPELAVRVKLRRDDVLRMGRLRARIIQAINGAAPPKRKSDLLLRGLPGEVTKADESGLTATLGAGKTEQHGWKDLNAKCVSKLTQLAMDPQDADDWVAVGLLSLARGDAAQAEQALDKAKSLGTDINRYVDTLAKAAFVRAGELVHAADPKKPDFGKVDLQKALEAVSAVEAKYATTAWFASNKKAFDAVRAQAGIQDAEAEALYAEAVKLYEEKELFDVGE